MDPRAIDPAPDRPGATADAAASPREAPPSPYEAAPATVAAGSTPFPAGPPPFGPAPEAHETAADAASLPPSSARIRRRPRLATDLTLLAIVGVLLLAAIGAGTASVYREFYSAGAFVERYLHLLSDGRAADALALPGVAADSAELTAAGLPAIAHDALLRRDALASLSDIRTVSQKVEGDVTHVTVSYRAGAYPGTTTFSVERDGWIGVAPAWRFASSPLAVIQLTVRGAMTFDVNGFRLDKRQVSPDGANADPLAPVALLAFSPGAYSVSVSTAISTSPGVVVLSDSPLTLVPVDIQTQPTEQFTQVVQQRVDDFLTACATQQVLQPTACPFGFTVEDRIVAPPVWSMVTQPQVTVQPDGAGWAIPATDAVAHIEVDIRSLFDGSVRHVSEDVPFVVSAKVTILPDGTASIAVGGG